MSRSVKDIILELKGEESIILNVLELYEVNGILSGFDLACLDEQDINETFSVDLRPVALAAWHLARRRKDAYWKIPSIAAGFVLTASSSQAPVVTISPSCPPVAPKAYSISSAKRCFTSFTRRVAFGKPAGRLRRKAAGTLAEAEDAITSRALQRTHEVFKREAADTPRILKVKGGNDLMGMLQLDVYRLASLRTVCSPPGPRWLRISSTT